MEKPKLYSSDKVNPALVVFTGDNFFLTFYARRSVAPRRSLIS